MKITNVEAIHLANPEIIDIANGTQDALVVKVYTDEGFIGIGEVDSSPHVAKAIIEAPMSHSLCHGLRELVIGENPFEVDKIWEKMYQGSIFYGRRGAAIHAMSGIDIALWDIMGKVTEKPIYQLLGGGYRKKIRAYASVLFRNTPQEMAETTKKLINQGFTAIKFGWGIFGQDPKLDIALVKAARKAAGDKIDIMIDAGLIWDAKTAIRMTKRLEEFNIFWMEEPLPPDDLAGYARVAESVDTPIAAGEEESTRFGFKELIEIGKIDILQPDLARAGGFTEGKKIAQLAYDHNRVCVPHAYSTGIVTAATVHFNAWLPKSLFVEYSMDTTALSRNLVKTKMQFKDGYVTVPDEPGLGVELNNKIIERYQIKNL